MPTGLPPSDRAKFVSARRAAGFVESGMKVGLGTGSTAAWLVRWLGWMAREEGLKITGVPTSARTAELARRVGLTTVPLDDVGWVDLAIDGADEYDADLTLIKGGGGALLREKIVALASDRMIMIADSSKRVGTLGAFPLPVAVVPFGWRTTKMMIEEALVELDVSGRSAALRMSRGTPYVTDEGNFILDLRLRRIAEPLKLSSALNGLPGVVENGLFIDICDVAVVGRSDGRVGVRDIRAGTDETENIDIPENHDVFDDIPE